MSLASSLTPVGLLSEARGSLSSDTLQSKAWSRRRAVDAVTALDLIAAAAAGLLPGLVLDFGTGLDWRHVIQASIVGGILTAICLSSRNIYNPALMHDFPVRPRALLTDVTIGILPVSGLALPVWIDSLSWWLWHLAWIASGFALLLTVHGVARFVFSRLTAAGRFDRRVAVFGAGQVARRLHDYLATDDHGMRFAGLYDDRAAERADPLGLTIEGKLVDLVAAAQGGHLDQVVIALPQSADQRIADIARKFDGLPVTVHIVTHLASDLIEEARALDVSHIGPVGLLDVKGVGVAEA